jgi:hypothetical protein
VYYISHTSIKLKEVEETDILNITQMTEQHVKGGCGLHLARVISTSTTDSERTEFDSSLGDADLDMNIIRGACKKGRQISVKGDQQVERQPRWTQREIIVRGSRCRYQIGRQGVAGYLGRRLRIRNTSVITCKVSVDRRRTLLVVGRWLMVCCRVRLATRTVAHFFTKRCPHQNETKAGCLCTTSRFQSVDPTCVNTC